MDSRKNQVPNPAELYTSDCYCDPSWDPKDLKQRGLILQDFKKTTDDVDLNIFTSGLRLGIILLLLRVESACVCEFQFILNQPSQPLVSHHLRVLKDMGVLTGEKYRRWVFYSITDKWKEPLSRLLTASACSSC